MITKDKIKDIWENWGYLLVIIFVIFIIFFGAVFYTSNSSKEIIHQKGVVIDQEHRHWTTITYIRCNKTTIPQVVHHDAWDTKVQIDNEDTIFTDNRKEIYDTASVGSKVKVLRYDYYFKGKYTGTTYYIDNKEVTE